MSRGARDRRRRDPADRRRAPRRRLLADLHALARELGLAVLVEAHDAPEIERALAAGATIVGVNNRDLATFEEDLGAASALAAAIPADVVAVAESAVRTAGRRRRLGAVGFDAVLVGERSCAPTTRCRGARPRRAGESEVVMDAASSCPPTRSRPPGTTRCRSPRAAAAAAAPGHEGAGRPRRPRAAVPDGAHRAGDDRRAAGSTSPARCSTSCGCGGRRRSCAPERLEQALGTPARIYYKDESVSPAGSHKPNTAVAQAFYNKAEGTQRLATETGAGPVGLGARRSRARSSTSSARSTWCARRTSRSRTAACSWRRGARRCVPSPVDDPTHPGSLGAAISDAVRDAGDARRHALLARLGAQPRAAAPDDHRDRGEGAARARGRDAARRRDRLVRRRIEPRRDRAAVHDRRRRCGCSRSSRRRARRSPAGSSTTTSATPRG